MLHFPNAKINTGLSVTEKRADGYHNIESVFYPIPSLKDALEVLPAAADGEVNIRFSGKEIAGDTESNLVLKAYHLLKEAYPDKVGSVHIHLLKSIPMGAGLGGGSADGAFMLRLLNKFFELNLSDDVLVKFALQLGSDCPFFIYNTPQYAKGRGEILEALPLDLSDYTIQIICPKVHVSTATAFSAIKPHAAASDLRNLAELPITEWKHKVFNDFETSVFAAHPVLAALKKQLYDEGAHYASMSGTGSAVYGIFEKGKNASLVSNAAQEVFCFG